jgi:hypothetical protein
VAEILTRRITRDKLARVFNSHEAIKLMEDMSKDVGSTLPDSIDNLLPAGGLTGQVLTKASSDDKDYEWTTPAGQEYDPVLTYTSGVLTRIDYDSGAYKLFTYDSGVLTRLDYIVGAVTTRKEFTYNLDGTLASITQTSF